eukprot:1677072-Rhodomonas_salina.1
MSVVGGQPQNLGAMPMIPNMNNQQTNSDANDSFQRLGSFGNPLTRLESAAPAEGNAMNLFGIDRLESVAAQNNPFARLGSDPGGGFGRVPSTPFSNANPQLDRLASAFPNFPNMGFGFDRTNSSVAQLDTSAVSAPGFGRLGSMSGIGAVPNQQATAADLQNLLPQQNQQQGQQDASKQGQQGGQQGQPPPPPPQQQQQQQSAQQQ